MECCVLELASLATTRKTIQKWTQNKEWSGKKGKSKGKSKLNSVENWQEGAQDNEHADGPDLE